MRAACLALLPLLALAACNGGSDARAGGDQRAGTDNGAAGASSARLPAYRTEVLGNFEEPWAMEFLPNGVLLITEKAGTMKFLDFTDGTMMRLGSVSGLPEVAYGGQGGLGDVVAHPDFAENRLVYISYAEPGSGDVRGAAVARGRLECLVADECQLQDLEVIWRQSRKVTGRGHYSHRIAFSPDGRYLFISSGDRQKKTPAQDLSDNLGTVVRLLPDGSVPRDNPFFESGGATAQIWSYGHRNILGLAFAPDGRLWGLEHGPRGGDELNLIERGVDYGWPTVSNGDNYSGTKIPDHDTREEFRRPVISWTPVIAPGNFVFYSGEKFGALKGDILAAGLVAKAIVLIDVEGSEAREIGRWDMDARIRQVTQGPDGAIWVLEDGGRLLKLTPDF